MQVFWARFDPDARNGLDCISLTDGKLIGRWENRPGLWPAQLLFAADGRVGVVADRPRAGRQVLNEAPCHVTCLAGERPQPLWTGTYPAADALVLVGGTLYGLDADVGGKHKEHAVWAADAMTGRLKGVHRAGPAFALSADSPASPLLLGSVLVLPLAAESPHTPPRLVWLDLATGGLLQSYVGARGSPAKALQAIATVVCTSRSDGATLALAYSGRH